MTKGISKIYACGFLLALSGYHGTTAAQQVKDIQADKFRYLKEKFSTNAVSKTVKETISKADNASVNFGKLVLTTTWHIVAGQSAVTPADYRSTWTYLSMGGPFVAVLNELSSNGLPITQF